MSPLGCACGWHATIHSLPSNKTEKKDKTSYKTQKSTKYEAFKLFLASKRGMTQQKSSSGLKLGTFAVYGLWFKPLGCRVQ